MRNVYKFDTQSNSIKNSNIKEAVITSMNEMTVTLTSPCKVDGTAMQKIKVSEQDNKTLLMVEVKPIIFGEDEGERYTVEYKIRFVNDFDLSSSYKVTKEGCGEVDAVFGNLYDCKSFKEQFTYDAEDLGASYTKDYTKFRLWTPFAKQVFVLIYKSGDVTQEDEEDYAEKHELKRDVKGTWLAELSGDYENKFYVYEVHIDNQVMRAIDPYAKAAGVNGIRAAIVDLKKTNPLGFEQHEKPVFKNSTDAIIYELHIRDLSVHEESNIDKKGKFLGLTETGTKNSDGLSTGLDHIKELGVTHVHLLPCFDYKTIDESKLEKNDFNWGYDPQNYNLPEGSYATNPYDASLRIKEFKQMVQALHENGLRVVMDVVYNHTFTADDSNFNLIVPKYYHRTDENGKFTDGSACGNETASERPMMRKFMLDSILYWAKEYQIDGFRFDLMALHDIETMNQIRAELNKFDPSILLYGEGWVGGESPLPKDMRALKENAVKMDTGIAVFSDDMRDGIKGSVFEETEGGFVNGATDKDEDVKFGIIGSVSHSQIDIEDVDYSSLFWAKQPSQTVNYASAHDNLTLWDKFKFTNPNATEEDLIRFNKLSAAIVLTSQGIPFFQAGEEMARTKGGVENSYRSPDSVNQIDWGRKTKFLDLSEYYKGLISLRKTYAAFRLTTAADIEKNIRFLDTQQGVIAYWLENPKCSVYERFLLVFNATSKEQVFQIDGTADVLVNEKTAGNKVIATVESSVSVPQKSAYVLAIRRNNLSEQKEDASSNHIKFEREKKRLRNNLRKERRKIERTNTVSPEGIAIGIAVAALAVAFIFQRRK